MKNLRTKITVETHRVVFVRDLGPEGMATCSLCAASTRWVTPDTAAAVMGVSSLKIYRRVWEHSVHAIETPGGLVLICLTSLFENTATDLISESISDA